MRVADTIFSGLESIGGFFESISHIGFMCVFFFQQRLFKSSFLRQLYQVDAEKIPPNVVFPSAETMVDIVNTNDKISDTYLKSVLTFLLLRVRFIYGYLEILHYFIRCKCIRFQRNPKSILDRRQVLYDRGNEKLERELDVVNLIKSIR